MKFAVYTDLHLAAKNPINRIDDYPQALLIKLKEIYKTAQQKDVDAVLFLGDFFNSHRIYSYDIINQAMDIICSSNIDTYSIIGQHDLIGYNPQSYSSSALCFLEHHCPKFQTLWEPKEFDDTVLYPCHVFDDLKEKIKQPITRKKKSLLLAHHLITLELLPFETHLIKDLVPCNYSAVLFGDYHAGMDITEAEGTLFWGIGSVARIAINEIDRKPRMGIIVTQLGKPVYIESIELMSTKVANESFNVTIVEEMKKRRSNDPNSFIEKIKELELESVDIYDLIIKTTNRNEVDKEIIEYILSKKEMVS